MKIEATGLDELVKKLSTLADGIEGKMKVAIYPAAGMVIEAIKQNTPTRTGDLRDSISLSKFEIEGDTVQTKIEFPGYDRNGTANTIKARVLESGTSKRQKKPFIRPAINSVRDRAVAEMKRGLLEQIARLEK